MRRRLFVLLATVLFALSGAGQRREKPPVASAACNQPAHPGLGKTFYACCADSSHGNSGWKGTRYQASGDPKAFTKAKSEADDHNHRTHGHGAIVIAD